MLNMEMFKQMYDQLVSNFLTKFQIYLNI